MSPGHAARLEQGLPDVGQDFEQLLAHDEAEIVRRLELHDTSAIPPRWHWWRRAIALHNHHLVPLARQSHCAEQADRTGTYHRGAHAPSPGVAPEHSTSLRTSSFAGTIHDPVDHVLRASGKPPNVGAAARRLEPAGRVIVDPPPTILL